MTERRRPAKREGFGIMNPYGDVWTPDVFETEEAARAYVANFWSGVKDSKVDVSTFRIVRVCAATRYVGEMPGETP